VAWNRFEMGFGFRVIELSCFFSNELADWSIIVLKTS